MLTAALMPRTGEGHAAIGQRVPSLLWCAPNINPAPANTIETLKRVTNPPDFEPTTRLLDIAPQDTVKQERRAKPSSSKALPPTTASGCGSRTRT
jgi:hypothetical protein